MCSLLGIPIYGWQSMLDPIWVTRQKWQDELGNSIRQHGGLKTGWAVNPSGWIFEEIFFYLFSKYFFGQVLTG